MEARKHPFLEPFPLVCAHRGDSAHFPENTLPAFRSAAEAGVDCIETDVHLTRDGECVVWHDASVERMSEGAGRIADYRLSELQQLDAGHGFSPDGGRSFPFREKGIHIPTLDQLLGELPDMRFNIDLKAPDPRLADRFTQVIRAHAAEERVLGASFSHKALTMLRERLPELITSFSMREAAAFLLRHKMRVLPLPRRLPGSVLQVPITYRGVTVVNPAFIRRAHRAGLYVQVWTINEERDMERLLDWGVDGIFTDHPSRLQALIRRRSRISV